MKKVYMLLSALMLGAGGVTTAHAQAVEIPGVTYATKTTVTYTVPQQNIKSVDSQVTDLSDITEGYYLIANTGRGGRFLNEEPFTGKLLLTLPAGVTADADVATLNTAFAGTTYGSYAVKFVKVADAENTYTIQLPSTKSIPTLLHGDPMTSSETAEQFTIEQEGTNFLFKGTNGEYFNGNDYTFTGWNDKGDNSQYKVFKVTTEPTTTQVSNEEFAPASGKYYQIIATRNDVPYDATNRRWLSSLSVNANTNGEIEAGADRKVLRQDASSNAASKLWSFEKNSDGTFKIRNVNNGKCLGQWVSNGTAIEMPISDNGAGSYTITPVNDNQFHMQEQGHYMNAFGGIVTEYPNNGQNFANYDKAEDKGGFWSFVEVTTIPLNIYHDTQWASANYPFAVTLPADLKAYTVGSTADNKAVLNELGTEVPANTPVLIFDESESGEGDYTTYDLTINYDATATAAETTNLLAGTTAARQGFEANASYVLAAGPSLKLTGDVTTIPANKAYLPTANVSTTAQALALSFGEATGIDHATVDTQANQQWYDLQGRRVLYPAKGIFVGQNGQKVLFK